MNSSPKGSSLNERGYFWDTQYKQIQAYQLSIIRHRHKHQKDHPSFFISSAASTSSSVIISSSFSSGSSAFTLRLSRMELVFSH